MKPIHCEKSHTLYAIKALMAEDHEEICAPIFISLRLKRFRAMKENAGFSKD